MKLLQKFKHTPITQITGGLLILSSGMLVLSRIFHIVPVFELTKNDWPKYFFLMGALLYCSPIIFRKLKMVSLTLFVVLCVFPLIAPGISAQDYTEQVEALAESFSAKNIDSVKPYLDMDLQFGPIPAVNTPAILTNMITNLPPLNSLQIIESKDGEVIVKYNFEQLGENQSSILFDEEGRITKIEYLEEIVMQEIHARQRLQNSVQQPNPGELGEKYSPEKVDFIAGDGLKISGHLYEINKDKPIILLLHRANFNKHEYADIAPKLNEMGYNALAIDQRSGGTFAGKKNETFERASKEYESEIQMIEAEQDIHAAIDFLSDKYGKKVTIWGNSYSSSLALFAARENSKVKAVISFSPGDYFGDAKPKLNDILKNLETPFLIASSKDEAEQIQQTVLPGIDLKTNQIQFVPESAGFHGSSAVWKGQEGADEYWEALRTFLNAIYERD